MTALAEAYYRRLYAFHDDSPVIPLEEFYNKNHDPQDGRFTSGPGGKMWSGVSGHPDHRTSPTFAKITKDRLKQSPEHIARQMYDTDLGSGYRSSVESAAYDGGATYVEGYIYKRQTSGDIIVGSFKRNISVDDNGKLLVYHDELFLDPDHHGKGIADRFNMHAVEKYQKYGVDRIELSAEHDVGGYAWARQGFRFNGDDTERRRFLGRQLERIETQLFKPIYRDHADRVRKEVKALQAALKAGEDVQPIHIASIGEGYARSMSQNEAGIEYPTWPGKNVLLGTKWPGVYFFDANRAVTAAATDLAHAALRPAFRTEGIEEFFNKNHDPNTGRFATGGRRMYNDYGSWGNSWQGSSTITGQSAEIMGISGYFAGGHPARMDERFGHPGLNDETRKAQIRDAHDHAVQLLGAIHDATPFNKPLYSGIALGAERFASLRPGDHIALPTTATSYDREFAHESGARPYEPGDMFKAETGIKSDVPVVLKFEAGTKAVKYQHNFREMITAGHFEVVSVDRVKSPYELFRRELNDLPVADAIEITLRQTHTIDPTQPITAAGEWLTLACHDPSCAPPPAGTGGSLPGGSASGQGKVMTEIGEIDIHNLDPMTGYSEAGMTKHLGSLAVVKEMTDREWAGLENDLDYEVKDFSSGSREPFAEAVAIANANVATVPRTTVGISMQLGAIWDRYADMTDDFKIMDKVTDALTRYEGEYQTDLRGARAKLSRQLEVISGVSVASGFVSYVHQQWANSAHSHESVAMQLIAAKDRKLTAAGTSLKNHMNPADLAVARTLVKKAPEALGAVFSATYRLTQRELAKHGITEIELYRGLRPSMQPARIIAQPSPLSSWSTSQHEAFNFSLPHGKMYKARIPVSQVYSLANLTGTGSLSEREVLVLGNRITATEHELYVAPADRGMFEDMANEEIPVVEIDAEDFDWIKKRPVTASASPGTLAAAIQEFFNKNHDKAGRFATGAGHKVITAAQARGDSRPVSHDEFQRLATIGQAQLDRFAEKASPITRLDRNWDRIKAESYAEVRKSWGGSTIDSHTGEALPQGANAFAITVKGKNGKTVSVHENATAEEFSAAMDTARARFGTILARQSHYLGVFHDNDNGRIDIDPVLVVHSSRDVETIGAASHSVGGAYNFRDGLGYFPPHVDTSPAATNKRDDYERTYDSPEVKK